jgi:hypothetical protein
MATRNGQNIQILVWNYHDDLVTVPASPVHLSVRLPAAFGGSAVMTHVRADDTHGDAYTVWVGQGSPAAPNATQIAAMQAAMQPVALASSQSVSVTGGMAAVDFDLPRFGISLVTLSPAASVDASTGGIADATADRSIVADASLGGSGGSGGTDVAIRDALADPVTSASDGHDAVGGGNGVAGGGGTAGGIVGSGGAAGGAVTGVGGAGLTTGTGSSSSCGCRLAVRREHSAAAGGGAFLLLTAASARLIRRRRSRYSKR